MSQHSPPDSFEDEPDSEEDNPRTYMPHMDPGQARDEVQDSFIGEMHSPAGYGNTSSTPMGQSFAGFDNEDSDDDTLGPARLFSIIEEGLPRPNDNRTDAQAQRAITEMTFLRIRRWLNAHTDIREREEAIAIRGNNDATPLHNVCKLNNPPADIILAFVEAVPESASWVDSHGWLPLHHACANGATDALKILTEAYPEGKTTQDSQKRTPLHFYLTQRCDNPTAMALNMECLCDSGAAELVDVGGMLPMHYACAYGVSPTVLKVLALVYPDGLTAKENKGRTPMHLAMVNAHREASPGVIRFLLENCGPEIVNST